MPSIHHLTMNTKPIISLCFLVIFFSTISINFSQEPPAAPVLDIHGNPVRSGLNYYILPFIRGRGGGLTLAATRNKTCPLAVAQEDFEVRNGLPLTFTPVVKDPVVRISTDHNIRFSEAASICVQSTVWKLDSYDDSTGKYFVTSGGVQGNPGPKTIGNWFKIEKLGKEEYVYKLVFCPTVCNFCKVICKDIGIFIQDGKRRLALTDDAPFPVFFNKA